MLFPLSCPSFFPIHYVPSVLSAEAQCFAGESLLLPGVSFSLAKTKIHAHLQQPGAGGITPLILNFNFFSPHFFPFFFSSGLFSFAKMKEAEISLIAALKCKLHHVTQSALNAQEANLLFLQAVIFTSPEILFLQKEGSRTLRDCVDCCIN